jgi:lipopolysaccharide/colanic/teichoic acid biosynthesis glycosyltransferase
MAAGGLLLAAPILLAAGTMVALTSPGGPLFIQQRVGRGGRPFRLFKLRTMQAGPGGPGVTAGGDRRVTPVGSWLRKFKVDELPQLWNVVIGDLSLVGPRPEVPQYVDASHPLWREVLATRPGLTDPVTLRLRNEEELLASVVGDHEQFYRRTLLPYKLNGYADYLRKRSWRTDLAVGWATVKAVVAPGRTSPPTLEEITAAAGPVADER